MSHNFEVPVEKDKYGSLAKNENYKDWKADSFFEFDDPGYKVRLHGVYRDLGTSKPRRALRDLLDLRDPEVTVEKYATKEYKAKIIKDRDDARNLVRNVAPVGGAPAPAPDVAHDKGASDASADLLAKNGGMVVGYDHKDQPSKGLLLQLVTQGKVKHVFIEELAIELQKDIDSFLTSPAAEMSPALANRIDELKTGKGVDFGAILLAAREKGAKVYGIDSVEADPGVDTSDPRYHERRLVLMNAVAKRVFDDVRKKHPGEPFVAGTGFEHVNTADGGIPGLAQIMGVPGVVLDKEADKIVFRPEDTGKRGLPSPLEQAFVDAFSKKANLGYAAALDEFKKSKEYTDAKPQPATTDKLDLIHVTLVAQKLAKQFVAKKKPKDAAKAAALADDPFVKNALAAIYKATFTREQRKADLKKAVDEGDLKALSTALDADPFLLNMDVDEVEQTKLIHAAAKKGHSGLVEELLKRGMDPNVTDLHGETPLHKALASELPADKKGQILPMVNKLLAGGADANLANPQGKTGLDLAKNAPSGGYKTFREFVKAGKASHEELFITRFVEDTQVAYKPLWKPPMAKLDDAEVQKAGAAIAKSLKKNLTSPDDVVKAMNRPEVQLEIRRLVKLTSERTDERNKIEGLIDANDVAGLKKLLTKDPVLCRSEIDEKTPLALAVFKGKFDIVDELVTNHGVPVDQLNSKGQTALLQLCSQEIDKIALDKQLDVTTKAVNLISRGANVNAKNRIGQTALHQAGFRNNVELIGILSDMGADPSIKDDRGWTAYDMTLGSTNKEAEEEFYNLNLADKQPRIADSSTPQGKILTSSIDILCEVTLCNDPKQAAEVRKNYETLYADPTMRPMLDLAAAAACNPRNPPKGGLRIFVNDLKTVGALFGQSVGPSGAYDEKVNTLLVPMAAHGTEKEPIGTLAHELTHLAAHLVTDDEETMPFEDDKEKQEYLAAIQADIKKLHLLNGNHEIEQFFVDRFSTRMRDYDSDKKLLQEYLVGVPQVASLYGMEMVEKLVPNLAEYYKKFSARCTEVLQSDDRFANGRDRISADSNKSMVNKLDAANAKPPTSPQIKLKLDQLQRVTPNSSFLFDDGKTDTEKVQGLMDKVRTDYLMKHGTQKAIPNRGIAYKADDFELSDNQSKELDAKLAVVEKELISHLVKGTLPSYLTRDNIPKLIETLSDACHANTKGEVGKVVKNRTANWVKNEKLISVDYRISKGSDMSIEELAEAIVYRAQSAAHGTTRIAGDTSVNQKKQDELIKQLIKTLGKDENESQLKDPKKLLASMSKALSTDTNKSVYLKGDDVDHVSIDKRKAKKIWLQQLQAIKA